MNEKENESVLNEKENDMVLEINETENESEDEKVNKEETMNKIPNLDEIIEAPKLDMTFDSLDDLIDYYKKYAKQVGFGVTKRSSGKGFEGETKYITVTCSRNGKTRTKSQNTLRPRPTSKTGCGARFNATLVTCGKWLLTGVVLTHNHTLSPEKSRFYRVHKVINKDVKRRLELNDRSGIRMNKSFNSFVVEAIGYENLTFSEKDCRNYIDDVRRLRLGDGDGSALQSYFTKVQSTDSNFFYTLDLDEENRLKNIFWADGRCRATYGEFGVVVTFDTTYLTNKYDMPFSPFVGVNHHGQSILLGCGLITSETTETFVWLFRSWLTCMLGRAPNAIITDQDRAMKNAIEIVFPDTRHRWCLWHIMKKIPEKFGRQKKRDNISFSLYNIVYDSLTMDEFETSWSKMIVKYELEKNDWLNGLYIEKRRWIPCYMKDTFWAGMSTTQRSETMNAFFDGFINAKTTLKEFVLQYENALRHKAEKENSEDFNYFNARVPIVTRYAMEKQVQQVYTTTKFREFQAKLTGKMYCEIVHSESLDATSKYDVWKDLLVGENKLRRVKFTVFFVKKESDDDCDVKCVCRLFEFRGILCRRALAVLIKFEIYTIPSKYLIRRWMKNIRRCHTKVRVSYSDWSVTEDGRRYNKMCDGFYVIADLASKSEVDCALVINWLGDLEMKLSNKIDDVCVSDLVAPKSVSSKSKLRKYASKDNPIILSPVAVRRKGRLPFKRKQSKSEQKGKKKKEKQSSLTKINKKDGDKTEMHH